MQRMHGLTLIELVVVLAVTAVLFGVGVPAWRSLTATSAVQAHVSLFSQAIQTARMLAVTRNLPVTLCALDTAGTCSGNWGDNLTLFYDRERDGHLGESDERISDLLIPDGNRTDVRWQGFGRRHFLNARSNGTWRQNGRFTFCPRSAGTGHAGRELVVNVTGRTRSAPVTCP
ncbi:MAG: GspH/FimT family pseudopilin [Pseudomonadota bacterium]